MAINFEAANMAGYNNPKIEVFEGVVEESGLRDAPNKSILLNCMNRGSIPVIMLRTVSDSPGGYLLYPSTWAGSSLIFTAAGASSKLVSVTLSYPENGEKPELILE